MLFFIFLKNILIYAVIIGYKACAILLVRILKYIHPQCYISHSFLNHNIHSSNLGHLCLSIQILDCTARMVLYVIKCSSCNSDYIGSTKHLRHRVSLHRPHIKCKHNRICPVSEHLDICERNSVNFDYGVEVAMIVTFSTQYENILTSVNI